ncbi:MAG: small multi-drug export protein [Syntrophomonadaceae bacterium]|nr:small multi-drug export protein [Syntrophomonadaceae bacterium]
MHTELLVLLTAATPVLELRGAIPLGLAMKLPIWEVFILSVIGNIIPVPFILAGTRKITEWLSHIPFIEAKLTQWRTKKTEKLSLKIHRWGWFGLLAIVAIPLPGTGAWTGSILAALLGLNFWLSLLSIIVGVVIAGLIVAGTGLTVLLAI